MNLIGDQLEQLLDAFCQVAAVPLTLFDEEGFLIQEWNPELRLCSFFDLYQQENSACNLNLRQSGEIASRTGDLHGFQCVAGFRNLTFPLISRGQYQGYFVLGPLLVDRVREEVVGNVITLNQLNENPKALTQLTMFLHDMKPRSEKEISQLSTVFRALILSGSDSQEDYARLSGLHRSLASLSLRASEHRGNRGELREPETPLMAFEKKPSYKGSSKVIHQMLRIIREEYMYDISLEGIAKKLYVNQSYLSMHFKHEMGITFTEYLTEVRIKVGKQLLRETNLSLLEVSQQCGFEDQSYFGKVFRKLEGCSPREYRCGDR